MSKIIQIAVTTEADRMGESWPRLFALTDGGRVLKFSGVHGECWELVPEPDWEALGLGGDPEPASESPWVKVGDRLPVGQNRLVLVKFSDTLGETVNTMWAMSMVDNINSGCITHWMEIPEVPCDK